MLVGKAPPGGGGWTGPFRPRVPGNSRRPPVLFRKLGDSGSSSESSPQTQCSSPHHTRPPRTRGPFPTRNAEESGGGSFFFPPPLSSPPWSSLSPSPGSPLVVALISLDGKRLGIKRENPPILRSRESVFMSIKKPQFHGFLFLGAVGFLFKFKLFGCLFANPDTRRRGRWFPGGWSGGAWLSPWDLGQEGRSSRLIPKCWQASPAKPSLVGGLCPSHPSAVLGGGNLSLFAVSWAELPPVGGLQGPPPLARVRTECP